MVEFCPNCGDKPIPCIAKEYKDVLFCGTNCIREFRQKEEEKEDGPKDDKN
ncbi:MAG: hypothetical protein WCX46_02365 [Candidatus Paceibacterota bacterium]